MEERAKRETGEESESGKREKDREVGGGGGRRGCIDERHHVTRRNIAGGGGGGILAQGRQSDRRGRKERKVFFFRAVGLRVAKHSSAQSLFWKKIGRNRQAAGAGRSSAGRNNLRGS